jgi:hypothetical protein
VANIGASIFLIALGAILAWAVTIELEGIDINMIGLILMIVGLVYLALSVLFWTEFSPFSARRRREYVKDRDVY